MIEAMCERSYRTAQTVINQSDLYRELAKAVKETAELIWHARGRLEEIDRKAHEEIDRLKQELLEAVALSPLAAGAAMAAAYAAIEGVINAAAAEAHLVGTATAAAIGDQASNITGSPSTDAPSAGQFSSADHTTESGGGGANIRPLDNPVGQGSAPPEYPASNRPDWGESPSESPASNRPTDLDPSAEPGDGGDQQGSGGRPDGSAGVAPTDPGGPGEPQPVEDALTGDSPGGNRQDWTPTSAVAPVATPAAAGGSGGSSALGNLGGGFKPPSASGLSSAGTGGLSTGSMSPGSGLSSSLPSSVSPAAGGIPSAAAGGAATPSDFSRGFNAGLGAGGAGSVLPPPVAPPPPQPLSSTTGAYSSPVSTGSAGVAAAGGAAAPSPPPPSSSVPAGHMGGPMGAPMLPPAPPPAGPLPPFNSDIPPRQVSATSGGSPAAGPPPAPPAGSGHAGSLPPGVVASGVGVAAAGAVAGERLGAPDPLLDQASALVYELMHASRVYGCIDWSVGMFKTSSGPPQAWVVSSEGSGFIPPGVFLPKSAGFVFSDSGLDKDFHARWFGWVNPAQTMVAYAQLCMETNPNVELWAVAASTDYGGNAAVARDAGVRHVENCALSTSPIKAESAPPGLDESRIHRLTTVDQVEYGRLTAGGVVDRAQMWALTVAAVRTVLSRASELLGFQVPPVIRQVATAMDNGESVSDELWTELDLARSAAVIDSSGQRPGRLIGEVGPSAYARCFHNVARAAELLSWWRSTTPAYVEIAYTARHIAKEAQLWPSMAE
jgi:hypothetical protein